MQNETIIPSVPNDVDTATIRRLFDEKIKELTIKTKETPLSERVAELEFKVGRLWNLLTEETPTKKTKLTTTGRIFAGKIPTKID